MQELLVHALRARRAQIHCQWEALLRVEPVGSPLGHPDALVHLIDWTLDEIFAGLTHPLSHHAARPRPHSHESAQCPCGRNPLLAYFAAGEQVMQEALVLTQAASVDLNPIERDAAFDELNTVFQQIARREIEAFCGVCQFRDQSAPNAVPSTFAQQPAKS